MLCVELSKEGRPGETDPTSRSIFSPEFLVSPCMKLNGSLFLEVPILTQSKPPKSQRGCYGTFKHKAQFLGGNIILLLINRRIILSVYIAPFL